MSTAAVVLDVMIASMARPREPTQSSRQSNTNVGTDPDNPLAAVLHGRPGHQRRHIVIVYQTPPQLQSFVLLVARRVAGDTLEDQSPVSLPFRTAERDARGGDLVYSVIEGRVVLEKKTRIRYQIEKLVRIAGGVSKNAANDPLPDPQIWSTTTKLGRGVRRSMEVYERSTTSDFRRHSTYN